MKVKVERTRKNRAGGVERSKERIQRKITRRGGMKGERDRGRKSKRR